MLTYNFNFGAKINEKNLSKNVIFDMPTGSTLIHESALF